MAVAANIRCSRESANQNQKISGQDLSLSDLIDLVASMNRLADRVQKLEAVMSSHGVALPAEFPRTTSERIREITKTVAKKRKVDWRLVAGGSLKRVATRARQEVMLHARNEGFSTPEIAFALGLSDHTTVIHGSRRAAERLAAE